MKGLNEFFNNEINERLNPNDFSVQNNMIDFTDDYIHIVMPKSLFNDFKKNKIRVAFTTDPDMISRLNLNKNGIGLVEKDIVYNVTGNEASKSNLQEFGFPDISNTNEISIVEIPGSNFISVVFSNMNN